MVAPGGKHQQCFGHRVHGVVEHHLANALRQRRATRLPGQGQRPALRPKCLGQTVNMGGLASTVYAFETDKDAAHGKMIMGRLLATLVFINGPIVLV